MSDDFIIKPESISQENIKQDIREWLNNKPDAEKWSSFYDSATGQALIDLIAGLSSFLKYDSMMARREAYYQFAINRSSIIGGAQLNGYSAFRGMNSVVKINLTPSTSGVFNQYDDLGAVKDRRIIVLEAKPYNAGITIDVLCVVGELFEETLYAVNEKLNFFRFTKKNVSEHFRLFIGSDIVDMSSDTVEMLNGKISVQSNPLGSIDAKYLNYDSFAVRYTTGTPIKLEWVDLKDTSFTPDDVVLDATTGVKNLVEIISLYQKPEENYSIQVKAPLENETKNAVRGRNDQAKIFKKLDARFIDAKGQDVSAAVMKIIYLMENEGRLTEDEKINVQDVYENYRPHGLQPPVIEDPNRSPLKLKITLTLQPKKAGNIQQTVDEVLSTRRLILGDLLDLMAIEQAFEDYDFIKIARVEITGQSWASNTLYELGEYIKASPDNGKVYRVTKILAFTGAVEPIWPTVAANIVNDVDIEWTAVPRTEVAAYPYWLPSTAYSVDDIAKPSIGNGFVYRVRRHRKLSDNTEPTWPSIGSTPVSDIVGTLIKDKNVLWIVREKSGAGIQSWMPNKHYSRGETIVSTDPVSQDNNQLMFQVYAYLGKSNFVQPAFSLTVGDRVIDKSIEWTCLDQKSETIAIAENQYNVITTEIIVRN